MKLVLRSGLLEFNMRCRENLVGCILILIVAVPDRSRWSSGVNGGSSGGGASSGGGTGGGSGSGGGAGGGAGGGGSSGRSSTAARDSRRQTRVIRTGRDRGSGLLGSQPQPVIPASVIPEELISQVTLASWASSTFLIFTV